MALTAQEVFARDVRSLPLGERLRLASLILQELADSGYAIVQRGDSWSEQDHEEVTAFSLEHASRVYPEDDDLFFSGRIGG